MKADITMTQPQPPSGAWDVMLLVGPVIVLQSIEVASFVFCFSDILLVWYQPLSRLTPVDWDFNYHWTRTMWEFHLTSSALRNWDVPWFYATTNKKYGVCSGVLQVKDLLKPNWLHKKDLMAQIFLSGLAGKLHESCVRLCGNTGN